jgi:hypothetical protein
LSGTPSGFKAGGGSQFMRIVVQFIFVILLSGCKEKGNEAVRQDDPMDTVIEVQNEILNGEIEIISGDRFKARSLEGVHPDSLLAFARTLIGIPYLYASTDPSKGFDCSGFITYVFNHFGVSVPRSSVDFTNYGRDIDTSQARPGDIILFTGTDSTVRIVGHMGIIESVRDGRIHFIHSTSGRNNLGVVITPFEKYYRSRFVKVIRIFPERYFN